MDTFDAGSMDCDDARQLISAAVDGELRGDEDSHLKIHLADCRDCSSWQERAYALRRTTAVRAAQPVRDLTPIIMRNANVPYVGSGDWVRILLGAVSLTMLVRAVPALIFGGGSALAEHADRHLGAFGVALAVGLGYAAWRPERAVGLLPLAGALVIALLATGVSDLIGGRSGVFTEAGHLLELAGLILLWLLAGGYSLLRHRELPPEGGNSPSSVELLA